MIGELIFSVVIFLGSIYLFYSSTQLRQIEAYKNVGAEFWPQIILTILIILMGYLLIVKILEFVRERKDTPSAMERLSPEFINGSLRFLASLGIIVAYVYCMKMVGFIVASPLLVVALILFISPEKKRLIPYGLVGVTVVVYLVFVKFLMIPLPRGMGIFYNLSLFLGI